MRDLNIAYGNSRQARTWVNKTIRFDELKEHLKVTIRTPESAEEYAKMNKAQRDQAKDHGGFVGGVLKGGRRKIDTVESRSMLSLDGDHITKEFLDNYETTFPYTSVLYTTHSSTEENPRARIVCPLTRDVTPEEFVAVSRYVAQMQVQEEMIRRANLHSGQDRKKRVYSSKYALSSIVYCSKCGEIYRRVVWNNRGKKTVVWRCCTRVENGPGACNADAIHESELQNLVLRAINTALVKKDTMYETLQKNVEAVLTGADGTPLGEIDSRLEELQKELLKVANSKGNYDAIADEIYRLREVKQNALVENAEREGMKQRISEMQQFLAEQTREVTEYDEQLVRRLIEKITVYDEWVTVEFKSGTSVDVRR